MTAPRPVRILLLASLAACAAPGDDLGGDLVAQPLDHRRHEDFPSVVYVTWEQARAGATTVSYALEGEAWEQAPTVDRAAGTHEQILLGLPYDHAVTWRVAVDEGSGAAVSESATFRTGGLPGDFPTPQVLAADAQAWDPEVRYLLGSISTPDFDFYTFVVDRSGRIVWVRSSPRGRVTLYPQLSHDGAAILVDHNAFWGAFDTDASTVQRIRLDGTVDHSYPLGDLHFPFVELADGSVAWGTTLGDGAERTTLRRMSVDGSVDELWSCGELYDALGEVRSCMPNGLSWSDQRGSLLMSQWSVNALIEVDLDGQVLHTFGDLPGAYGFAEEGTAFHLSHGSGFTGEGTLLVSTQVAPDDDELVVREYAVDADAGLLRQVWSFGEGQGVLGPEAGGAERLPSGNTLHNYGTGTRLREITPDGQVVWDLAWFVGEEPGHQWLGQVSVVPDLYALVP